MARPDSDRYELTDAEKRDLIKLIEQGKPLPEKFRFLLFDDKREVELVWNGKSREVSTAVLPFQTLEHIDEPRKEKKDDEEFSFDTRGRQQKGWTNKLIWGDNKLILSSLKSGALRRQIEDAGGLKLIYIDPPFDVGADFSMDIEIGGETFHKEPNLLEQIAYRDTWGRGADSFIAMIYERLILMRDLMHSEGSIYVHCDWRVNSFIRGVMDEIFSGGYRQPKGETSYGVRPSRKRPRKFGNFGNPIFGSQTHEAASRAGANCAGSLGRTRPKENGRKIEWSSCAESKEALNRLPPKPMRYTPPNTVTSPRDCVSNIRVIFDGGTTSPNHFSVAKLDWEGSPCIVMRWNVGQREWDDPEKQNNQKVCLGMPVSRGFPVWFVLPEVLLNENSEIWKQIKSKL